MEKESKKQQYQDSIESINTLRCREFYSPEEATADILKKYDVETALDGSFLIFINRETGAYESPIGGLGPFFKVAAIIESELVFPQPEAELIGNVVLNLYKYANEKPSIAKTEKQEAKEYFSSQYSGVTNDSEETDFIYSLRLRKNGNK